jgi:hypothetical protein
MEKPLGRVSGSHQPPAVLTVDVDALRDLFGKARVDKDGNTVAEICEATGRSPAYVRTLIQKGLRNGTVGVSERYVAQDWDGRSRIKRVYYMVKSKTKAAAAKAR